MTEQARAVFFDLDDTLVDSGYLWLACWRALAARHRRSWSAEESTACMGSAHWSQYVANACGGLAPEEVMEACTDQMIDAVTAGRVQLLGGAAQMVASAAARVPVAVVSAAPRRYLDAALAALGLKPLLSVTVAWEDVTPGKPDPGPYLHAAQLLSVDPRACVAVEDSGSGIRSAHAAGMTVVAIPNPVTKPSPEALALATHHAHNAHNASALILKQLQHMEPIDTVGVLSDSADRNHTEATLATGEPSLALTVLG